MQAIYLSRLPNSDSTLCHLDHYHRSLKHQCPPFLVFPPYDVENEYSPSPKLYSELFITELLPNTLDSCLKSL